MNVETADIKNKKNVYAFSTLCLVILCIIIGIVYNSRDTADNKPYENAVKRDVTDNLTESEQALVYAAEEMPAETTAVQEPARTYPLLNLPITTTEQTFHLNSNPPLYIDTNGILFSQSSRDGITYIDTDVRSLLVVEYSTFYIKNDNSLWAYGSNSKGILGDGTGVNQATPIKILDNVAWVGTGAVESGGSYGITRHSPMYAIKTDKTLWKWGDDVNFAPVMVADDVVGIIPLNYSSNRGDGKITPAQTLIKTSGGQILYQNKAPYAGAPPSAVYDIFYFSHNNQDAVYIDADKNLYINHNGATRMIAENVVKFYTSYFYTAVTTFIWAASEDLPSIHFITTDGTLWGYGTNNSGQLGDGTKIPERREPVKIAENVAERISSRAFLTTNGEIYTWDNDNPTPQMLPAYSYGNWTKMYSDMDNIKIPRTVIFE
ncbi:MAG: hypothetical protein FWH24_03975 [Oscillospiraceae bacterium]|nr:hypothetical protein [Oscillospiraceae bacterium]